MRKKLDGGARILLTRLQARGYGAYIVGGAVRDMLRGATPHDYDIATSAVPAQTRAVFTDLRTYDTGAAHGTVGVIYDGKTYEITTFRRDGAYSDGRRPDAVEFTGDLCEDLARRDFTVNAMAMDADGRVCDPFSGKADLSARRIRCVGDPDRRFAEDGLRLLRALRLAAQLDFTIEANTAQAMRRQAARLGRVSAERKWTELSALLKTGRAGTKDSRVPGSACAGCTRIFHNGRRFQTFCRRARRDGRESGGGSRTARRPLPGTVCGARRHAPAEDACAPGGNALRSIPSGAAADAFAGPHMRRRAGTQSAARPAFAVAADRTGRRMPRRSDGRGRLRAPVRSCAARRGPRRACAAAGDGQGAACAAARRDGGPGRECAAGAARLPGFALGAGRLNRAARRTPTLSKARREGAARAKLLPERKRCVSRSDMERTAPQGGAERLLLCVCPRHMVLANRSLPAV